MHFGWLVGWLEFNVPFQHKYGYIRDEQCTSTMFLATARCNNKGYTSIHKSRQKLEFLENIYS